MSEFVQLTLIP